MSCGAGGSGAGDAGNENARIAAAGIGNTAGAINGAMRSALTIAACTTIDTHTVRPFLLPSLTVGSMTSRNMVSATSTLLVSRALLDTWNRETGGWRLRLRTGA